MEKFVRSTGWKVRDQSEVMSITYQVQIRLGSISTMIDEEKYGEALDEIESFLENTRSHYVEATLYQMQGYVHGIRSNEDLSIESFEKALATEALLPQEHQGVLYSLANMYASKENFEKAIELMRDWFLYEKTPFAQAFMFTGTCFMSLEQYEDALPFVERAIDTSDRPIESWYSVAASLQLELEKYDKAIATFKVMLTHWTQVPEHWEHLANTYLQIGEGRKALDVLMTAYINGMVRLPERIMSLVQLNLTHGIPFTAGEILESEMNAGVVAESEDNLNMLIQVWINAREYDRAIAAIEKIAKFSSTGDYYMQAAQLSVQVGSWSDVVDSAGKALDAGADNVNALMMMGAAYFEQDLHLKALEAFNQVRELSTGEERENADLWIAFVEETLIYQAQVSAAQ